MNLLADESVDQSIVRRLREDGHRVWSVAEMEPGISDDAVLEQANREQAVLVTADKGFGDLVFRQRRTNAGVVLLRLAGLSSASKAKLVASCFHSHPAELAGAFTVISPIAIRIRNVRGKT